MRSLNAVSILRVSTKKQLEGEGIGTQRKGCNEHMTKKAYKHIKEFVLAESAKADSEEEREDFGDVLTWCAQHKKEIGVVVIWKVDRFSRAGLLGYYAFKQHLSRYGIRLESATEHIDDSASGEALEGLLAVFARLDNRMRTDRTISAEKELTAQGFWCRPAPTGFINAAVTIGYTADGKPIQKPILKPTPDAKQWELLCYGLRQQITGLYKPAVLARELAAKGLCARETSRKGVRRKNLMSEQTWTKVCRNPVCGGLICEKWTGYKIIKAQFDGAITPDEWHELQRVLDAGGRKAVKLPRMKLNPAFPLRQFMLCPSCNLPVRGYPSKGKGGNRYAYYDCSNKACKFRVDPQETHDLFVRFMEKLKPSKELLNLFRAVLLRDWDERHKELNRESIELQQKESALTQEKKDTTKLITLNAKNEVMVNALSERLLDIDKELTVTTLAGAEKKIEAYDAETVINYCVYYMENVSELWQKAPVEKKYCFQSLIFPDGLPYDVLLGKRTPKLSLLYTLIEDLQSGDNEVAGPRGIEPRLAD